MTKEELGQINAKVGPIEIESETGREFQMVNGEKIYSMEIRNEQDRKMNDFINQYRASGGKGGMQAFLRASYGFDF